MAQNKVKDDTKLSLQHLELARLAADGDSAARAEVNHLAHNIISFQTSRFCKRFCRQNKYRYICTLTEKPDLPPRDAIFCEWGNASYTWMLDDLTNGNRLLQYQGKNGARLNDYFYHIANSLPFYERWKDWRFGRKVHVPTYIQELFPEAKKIFYALRAGESVPIIAQKLHRDESQIEDMCQKIIMVLTQKKKLHLLDPPKTISLDQTFTDSESDADSGQMDIPDYDDSPEMLEDKARLSQAWDKLTPVEQYIIEAMVMDEQDAADVLEALKKLKISIKEGVSPEATNRQQLYYFRRKTLAKPAESMQDF